MAKRRKEKDEDEDKPFKMPKFDKEAFLKRERRNIKANFIAFLFGFLMALICFGFWVLNSGNPGLRWILVSLVGIFSISFIRYFYARLNIDISDFTRKNWFFAYATYIFTWLLIFMIIVNPPFYDDEGPKIEIVTLPEIQEIGGTILIAAKITDNIKVSPDSLQIEIFYPDESSSFLNYTSYDDNVAQFIFENHDNITDDFSYTLTAKDINDHTSTASGSFSYDEDTIEITTNTLTNLDSNDDIEIEVDVGISEENFRVYYTLNNGNEINVNRQNIDTKDEYETSPMYEGWVENDNYNMSVYAEVSHYFAGIDVKYSNIIVDSIIYNVSTTNDDSDIGDEPALVTYNWSIKPNTEQPNTLNYDTFIDSDNNFMPDEGSMFLPYDYELQVPGFEAIILIAALVVAALIFKKKKKDEKRRK